MNKISTFLLPAFLVAATAVPALAGGVVSVPEPSSLALLVSAIGSIGGVVALRRFRNK